MWLHFIRSWFHSPKILFPLLFFDFHYFNLLFFTSLIIFLLLSTFFAGPPDKLAEALIFMCEFKRGSRG